MLACSYFGLGALTVYAVRTPLKYKLSLDITRVARFIVIGWIVVIALLVVVNLSSE